MLCKYMLQKQPVAYTMRSNATVPEPASLIKHLLLNILSIKHLQSLRVLTGKDAHAKIAQLAQSQLGYSYAKTNFCLFVLIDGGDEENRTPVRKRCHIDFSERSQCLDLRLKQTQTTAVHPILEKFPIGPPGVRPQVSRNWPLINSGGS